MRRLSVRLQEMDRLEILNAICHEVGGKVALCYIPKFQIVFNIQGKRRVFFFRSESCVFSLPGNGDGDGEIVLNH